MLNAASADVYTDFNGLAKLKNEAKNDSPAALKEAAKQFEAIFLNTILKGMRQAKLADGALDNEQSKFYNDMYDQQLALNLAGKPGIGLAGMIEKQLNPNAESAPAGGQWALPDYRQRPVNAASRQPSSPVTLSAYAYRDRPLGAMTAIPFGDERSEPMTTADAFVADLYPYAQQAGRALGVDPKALLAQAALETGWGRSVVKNHDGSSSFNVFNIKADKAWQGRQARVSTLEYQQGAMCKVNAGFRSYRSYRDSFEDYVAFIQGNPRYADALKHAGDTRQYLRELQQAGYATDPHYADKVMGIFRSAAFTGVAPPDTVVAMN